MPSPHKPLVVIVGPTAVGKSELAIRVAEALDGEIISADSRLFYRGMDIGTAKPSIEERARVPHHLIDVANPDELWSLAHFQKQARVIIDEVHARGKLPLLVGGTGQYIRAVVEGWQPPSQPPDHRLRQVLEAMAVQTGAYTMHRKLAILDPEAAYRIDPRNVRRTIRALEVIFYSGRRFSAQRGKTPSPYNVLRIGLTRPRGELYQLIDARIDRMIRSGLVDEVQRLLSQGYGADLPSMSAIGYRQVFRFLRGECSLEEAIAEMKRLTRRYVRQQGAWFREEDPDIYWFTVDEQTPDRVIELIHRWLTGEINSPV
ncbi:tRNA dimethylallyltransferase [Anaerolinea thermolimosa]|nr:tRNA dimethylallyltransferase [Anaerolinea thermolimosa]